MEKTAEKPPEEQPAQHDWWSHWSVTLCVLVVCVFIAAAAFGEGQSVEQMLGEWRTGVIVFGGAALLFAYTVWMNAYFRFQRDMVAAEHRQQQNRDLLDDLDRRLSRLDDQSRV